MSVQEATVNVMKRTNVRWMVVALLFTLTAVNYADRATISIAGPVIQKDLGLTSIHMGYIFSAFGWAYVIAQLPGGWLLDRFGSKKVYFIGLLLWSVSVMLQSLSALFVGITAAGVLFVFRYLMATFEAPSFPANARVVAAWFPGKERGTASAIFNAAQYFATVIFAPLMAWIVTTFGWHHVFIVMGSIGLVMAFVWLKFMHDPKEHPMCNEAEVQYIAEGGGLVSMDVKKDGEKKSGPNFKVIKQLITNRMFIGIYLAQYCINALTFFFISWFPVYLVQARGMDILHAGFAAAIPALCGFGGGILGGVFSDFLIRKGHSLSFARKTPIVLGMMLSMAMVLCNYVDSIPLVILFMAMSFFGKAFGALGWAVGSDTFPKEVAGLAGGLFNMCGNLSSITTPIAIGYIVATTGSFEWALVFTVAHGIVAAFSYLVIVGDIHRVEIKAA
jgi:ACS family glucarate transporter-like MFS transporter